MANINVKSLNVEHGADQIAGQPFMVTVGVNNREMVAAGVGGGQGGCEIDAESHSIPVKGHKAEVSVTILSGNSVVEQKSTQVCAPVDFSGVPDPHPSWEFALSPGTYTVEATVTPVGVGASDTERVTVYVRGEADAPDADDGGGGGGTIELPGGDDDGGGGNPLLGGGLGQLQAIIVLALLAWLASSASNTVESVS